MSTKCVSSIATSATTATTTIGSFCASLTWRTLGYFFSSVASIISYCTESITHVVTKAYYIIAMITTTTNICVVIIVVLCLLYLKLSKSYRNLHRHAQSLGPHRRDSPNHIHLGFDSDSEYSGCSYIGDSCMRLVLGNNNNFENEADYSTSFHTDDISEMDNVSDSDDNTVMIGQSDSDDSTYAHIFSTESNVCRMDRHMSPLAEHSASCRRQSLIPEEPKRIKSPEDFDRELEKERDKRICVVCQSRSKSVVNLPCKHMCMCAQCANQIVRSQAAAHRVCPLCRVKITRILTVYV